MSFPLTDERIAEENQRRRAALEDDYAHLGGSSRVAGSRSRR